jgi:hypothetical protein
MDSAKARSPSSLGITKARYGSFFGQLAELSEADPSGASPVVIVAIKGAGLAVAIVCLWLTSRRAGKQTT